MLVIISDLHLNDGTTGKSITPDAFKLLRTRINETAYHGSWRSDGKYRPIELIDIVLVGDVFDHIRSARWDEQERGMKDFVRPWHEPNSRDLVDKIREITEGIITDNEKSFGLLKDLSKNGVRLPPANASGNPVFDADANERVPVNIHYMIGNHDWFFHLPAAAYNPIRQRVIDTLGLSNPVGPFPHDPKESDVIRDLFGQYQILARHGDIYDTYNYNPEKGRDHSTLGDATTIDLIGRFPIRVRKEMGDDLPSQFLYDLRELENLRPSLMAPVWIQGIIDRGIETEAHKKKIKDIWDRLADEFIEMPFVRSHDSKLNPFETVDWLERIIRLTAGAQFKTLSDLASWITQKSWGDDISLRKHALTEEAFLNHKARYIIYGHTHQHEIIPLDSNKIAGHPFDQVYINSGTWQTYHQLTIKNPKNGQFVTHKSLTYLTFFKDDERSGRPFEAWTATLSSPYNSPAQE